MLIWYMGRFIDYMFDLKGKIVIWLFLVWKEGGDCLVGLGGMVIVVLK